MRFMTMICLATSVAIWAWFGRSVERTVPGGTALVAGTTLRNVDISSQEARDYVATVVDAMRARKDACVSAAEVGGAARIAVTTKGEGVFINPVILAKSDDVVVMGDGQLVRSWVDVHYIGARLQQRTERLTGLNSDCVQLSIT